MDIQILNCKSSLLKKFKWKKYPIHRNWLKSTNSRHFWMSGIHCQRYKKHGIFLFLRPNSYSVTKIQLNWCPWCQNWLEIGYFQAISRVPENFWKFPGLIENLNFALKIKFLTKVEWEKYPIHWNWSKSANSRALLDFWMPGIQDKKTSRWLQKC